MGMFDTVEFVSGVSPELDAVALAAWLTLVPTCAAGHEIRHLQTKDFDCDGSQYVMWSGMLWKLVREKTKETPGTDIATFPTDLVRSSVVQRHYQGRIVDTAINAYSYCEECRPVLFLTDGGTWSRDPVQEMKPWCEYTIRVLQGRVLDIEHSNVESRDVVAARHSKLGYTHIPDTDLIAQKHFENVWSKRNKHHGW